MIKCQNCQASLSCGCQKRTASNGKSVCANCIVAYENSLKLLQKKNQIPEAPKNVSILYNKPK